MQSGQGEGTPVHTIQTISEGSAQGEVVDLNSVTEATLNSEGQIILTAEDGHGIKCIRMLRQLGQHIDEQIKVLYFVF